VNGRQRRSVSSHAFTFVTPLILAARRSIRPRHVLRSATVVLLTALTAPEPVALRHVRANGRSRAKYELTLLVVGELFSRQHGVARFLNHISMRLIQQTGALLTTAKHTHTRERVELIQYFFSVCTASLHLAARQFVRFIHI
jgi:hypothetical protein